jgi:hypothetical protein
MVGFLYVSGITLLPGDVAFHCSPGLAWDVRKGFWNFPDERFQAGA